MKKEKLKDLILEYRQRESPHEILLNKCLKANAKNWAKLIEIAVSSKVLNKYGVKIHYSHQSNINTKVYAELKKILVKKENEFKKAKNFEEIYDTLNKRTSHIKGFGPLFLYDLALRLSYYFDKQPKEFVYIHAGVKDGLKNHFPNCKPHKAKIETTALTNASGINLNAQEWEDFLCIYKDGKGLKQKKC